MRLIIIALAYLCATGTALAEAREINTGYFNKLAMNGYDVIFMINDNEDSRDWNAVLESIKSMPVGAAAHGD